MCYYETKMPVRLVGRNFSKDSPKILLQRNGVDTISCAHPNRKAEARMAELVDALD